jgi:8-oxo-dGTP pyrophosphatase MutT (NUDIX family)
MEESIEFAQKAVIIFEGNLLMVQKSSEDPYNPTKWELPGGRMQPGESVDDHLRREIMEEVGLKVTPGPPVHLWSWNLPYGDTQSRVVVAVARECEIEDHLVNDKNRTPGDYLGEIKWVPLADVMEMDVMSDQKNFLAGLIPKAAPAQVSRRRFRSWVPRVKALTRHA